MVSSLSPLRYPGGKKQLEKFIVELFALQEMENITYIEPFAGGSGLALSLLEKGVVNKLILNDYDVAIYAFWHSVLNNHDAFIRKIEDTSITIDEWERQKQIYSQRDNIDMLTLGFSTFFLNRTNRSGIIKAGAIGGRQQLGNYKIDCRFNKIALIKKIEKIASFKKKIKLTNLDATVFIKKVVKKIPTEKAFIFFDPPYFKQGKDLYTNFYEENDHACLFKAIDKLKKYKWIVTYDDAEQIRQLYQKYSGFLYSLNYSLAQKKKAQELMFYSQNVINILRTEITKTEI
ncbi:MULTISPECIES: DNA adenine methylase [unclassified Gilliamella]|uniref:DNA adenine methylase n=1 Tax=unclassified Gilliamella TaxID=2685620 RepID=UPI00226AAEC9|nr:MULTISPECIES: DNA adenine methylase [unclassified Gilliamella]MCX8597456.1 DNA adenine methylase [Gilliamella sp. B3493]MCX8599761.1 DNA adenine methylase [Gilliamella sp. B3486]MCX8690036.1 DNA adenine methylase [Gilliamella sp. B2973]MCX8705747.1 DNA adenine methylase [Gilliamella sp. B3127]